MAALVLQHRAVDAAQHFPADRQHQRTEADWQRDGATLQLAPFPVQQVSLAGLVHRKPVHVDQVGPVYRVGPAEMLVVA